MYLLDNWRIACEYGIIRLHGQVYNRAGMFQDGEPIYTSRIAGVEGRVVTTKSGSKYELGAPSQFFKDRYETDTLDCLPYASVKVNLDDEDLSQLVDMDKVNEYVETA